MTSFHRLRVVYLDQLERIVAGSADITPDRPTGLGDWDAITLVGHIGTGIEALWRWQGDRRPGPPLDVASYWAPAAAVAGISADWASDWAARRSPAEILGVLDEAVGRARTHLVQAEPDSAITPPLGDGWLTLEDFLGTRLVEATVHGLDLELAGCGVGATEEAVTVTAELFDRIAHGARPADLTDDRAWVLAATGRSHHDDPRLPLLA